MLEVHILHFILGITLFFLMNWVGKHSYSVGYLEISMFLKVEEAPAFNFLFRIISPIVFLFITSAILYKIGLDRFVNNIYFISIYYIIFRLGFNLITNRGLLMNWYRQGLYWISISIVSYFSYTEIIYKKENILPDFESFSNELWIIILVFLFHTFNQIRLSSDKTIQRKDNYLNKRLSYFESRYSNQVLDKLSNDKLRSIAYAIMIYEDFNRPRIIRIIENFNFLITKKPHSLGLMQVKTNDLIDDDESVKLGLEKLNISYSKALKERGLDKEETITSLLPDASYNEISIERDVISDYNKDDSYVSEVRILTEKIFNLNPAKEKSYLFPKYNPSALHSNLGL